MLFITILFLLNEITLQSKFQESEVLTKNLQLPIKSLCNISIKCTDHSENNFGNSKEFHKKSNSNILTSAALNKNFYFSDIKGYETEIIKDLNRFSKVRRNEYTREKSFASQLSKNKIFNTHKNSKTGNQLKPEGRNFELQTIKSFTIPTAQRDKYVHRKTSRNINKESLLREYINKSQINLSFVTENRTVNNKEINSRVLNNTDRGTEKNKTEKIYDIYGIIPKIIAKSLIMTAENYNELVLNFQNSQTDENIPFISAPRNQKGFIHNNKSSTVSEDNTIQKLSELSENHNSPTIPTSVPVITPNSKLSKNLVAAIIISILLFIAVIGNIVYACLKHKRPTSEERMPLIQYFKAL